ncbi:AcrR family transcriptional regulator [Mumia flava]|uniref:AcrR family transcriptional regulator n=1 Tax=Mumia flava TaxID=1348852 RepID=A0A0B2AWE5_9ACTN|nr:TetR/AcrR family transcriptional regulator [Mumia flava]PJJ56669.1 AcrR family transcriptional regulator [Mumia flava]
MSPQAPVRAGSSPSAPATARGVRTRAALVAAARTVFERDGFTDAKVTDIAAEAGCATGSFYTYFASKEEALSVVLYEAQREVLDPAANPPTNDEDPWDAITASHRAYFASYRRNARLMLLMEQVAAIDPEFREIRRRFGHTYAERTARTIAELQDRGLADPELDPFLAARALRAMVTRTAYYAYALGDTVGLDDDADLEALVRTTTRLWRNALQPTPYDR